MPHAALGALLLLPWLGVALLGDLRHGALPWFLVLYFAASSGYLAALVRVARRPQDRDPRALVAIGVVAVALRLLLLATTPSLSDDAWRYRWEGRVQLAGANPYATPPAEPALAPLRDGEWLKVNHPEVPAVYGPALELLFAALAPLPGGLLPLKLAFLAADLLLLWLVLAGLRRRGGDRRWALVYAWHPLVLLEVAGQGHLEVIPIALLALALELEERARPRAAALALGLAIAAKYLPVLLVPAFLLAAPRGRRLARLGWIALPVALCALPYLGAAAKLGAGLAAYGATWRCNDGGFFLLDRLLEAAGLSQAFCRHLLPAFVSVPAGFDPALHQTWMRILPKLCAGALGLCGVAWLSRPRTAGAPPDLRRAALGAGALFLLLSPTVHPWYGLWLVPFLPGSTAREGRAAWLYLSLILPLAYVVLLGYSGLPGSWRELPAVRAAEWLPTAGLLAWALWSSRARDAPEAAAWRARPASAVEAAG